MSAPQIERPPRPPRTPGERVLIFSGVCCVPAVLLFALRTQLGVESSPVIDALIFAPIVEAFLGIGMIEFEKMLGKFPPK